MVISDFGGADDFEIAGGVAVDAVEGEGVDGMGAECDFYLFVDNFSAVFGFADVEGDGEFFFRITVAVEAIFDYAQVFAPAAARYGVVRGGEGGDVAKGEVVGSSDGGPGDRVG